MGGFGAGPEFSWQALLGLGIQVATVASIFKGCEEADVPNNTALIFSELMDPKSLFLTANADTVYFWVNLDVTNRPIVVENRHSRSAWSTTCGSSGLPTLVCPVPRRNGLACYFADRTLWNGL